MERPQTPQSLQDTYAPTSQCFGCGPANPKGLRIKSFAQGDALVADWQPELYHQAFEGVVNGGIVGALLDCHSNWAAAHALMRERRLEAIPCTVTGDFHVTLRRPTPLGHALHLVARAEAIDGDRVRVHATLEAAGKVCATCVGNFVAVREGHPAFHRWGA